MLSVDEPKIKDLCGYTRTISARRNVIPHAPAEPCTNQDEHSKSQGPVNAPYESLKIVSMRAPRPAIVSFGRCGRKDEIHQQPFQFAYIIRKR